MYIYIDWSHHISTKWYILNIFDLIKIGLGEKLWYLGWSWLIPTCDVHLLIIIALIEGHTHIYINIIYIYIYCRASHTGDACRGQGRERQRGISSELADMTCCELHLRCRHRHCRRRRCRCCRRCCCCFWSSFLFVLSLSLSLLSSLSSLSLLSSSSSSSASSSSLLLLLLL